MEKKGFKFFSLLNFDAFASKAKNIENNSSIWIVKKGVEGV